MILIMSLILLVLNSLLYYGDLILYFNMETSFRITGLLQTTPDNLYLESIKVRLEKALRNLIQLKMSLLMAGDLDYSP